MWERLPSYSMERPADYLPLFADLPPYRHPGTQWQYCNAGYIVLGLVIEELTGRPYADVVQERVFDRAGMTDSGFFRLDEVAAGHRRRLPAAHRARTSRGGRTSTASRWSAVPTAARSAPPTTSTGSCAPTPTAPCSGDHVDRVIAPHADAGDGFFEGYGVHLYPDGRYGHGGGDPGVAVIANRWPDDDVHIIVLCNVEEGAIAARNAVEAAWHSAG